MRSQVLGSVTAIMKALPALISLASSEAPCSRAKLCKTRARSSSVSFLNVPGLFGKKRAMIPARPTVAMPSTLINKGGLSAFLDTRRHHKGQREDPIQQRTA